MTKAFTKRAKVRRIEFPRLLTTDTGIACTRQSLHRNDVDLVERSESLKRCERNDNASNSAIRVADKKAFSKVIVPTLCWD